MATRKITVDRLGSEIEKIISKYNDELIEKINVVGKRIAQKGRTVLKNDPAGFNTRWGRNKYTSGWRVSEERTRVTVGYEIHQAKQPTLTHLLENGHAMPNGGRAKAYPHIDPVAEVIAEDFERAVIDVVRNLK